MPKIIIEPLLEHIEFDTVGLKFHSETNRALKVWTNPEADVVTLNLFRSPPDIRVSIRNLEELRNMYREQVTGAKGGLIEVSTLEISGLPCIKTIFKLPQKMTGVAYVASITIPFKDFSFVLKITCQKRGIGGTYVSVEPFHLFRYVDEQAFRFNNRKHVDGSVVSDYERFKIALSQIIGKRLTYNALIGKEAETSASEEAF